MYSPSFFRMLLAIILVGFAVFSDAAPRSRSKGPQLVYDQKQHGDYNIQVHLKDFQIIALVGEDSLGGLGDYDYNYDYSDFTVKPPGSSSSAKPTISSTSPNQLTSTKAPEKPITSVPNNEGTDDMASTTSVKPLGLIAESRPEDAKPSTDAPIIIEKVEDASSTEKTVETTKKDPEHLAADAIPGQIQVQVIHTPEDHSNIAEGNDKIDVKEAAGKSNDKKCSSGFSRDKRGRCRRVRKPQSALPFDFGRLAHLAARLRSNDNNAHVKSPTVHSQPQLHI